MTIEKSVRQVVEDNKNVSIKDGGLFKVIMRIVDELEKINRLLDQHQKYLESLDNDIWKKNQNN